MKWSYQAMKRLYHAMKRPYRGLKRKYLVREVFGVLIFELSLFLLAQATAHPIYIGGSFLIL